MSRRATGALVFIFVVFTELSVDAEPADPREAEVKRLWDEVAKIPPRETEAIDELANKANSLYRAIHSDKAAALEAKWETALDPEIRRRVEEDLVREAIVSEQLDLVIKVATGGAYPAKQIRLPDSTKAVSVQVLKTFHVPDLRFDSGTPAIVIRRMTKSRFELWTPKHGWLFDERGQTVNEATPPRRDGDGREWYGAFLPDGSWVTTDLWEMDRTLTFFSRRRRWRREIAADELVPREKDSFRVSLIGWCRCDREGRGFVVSVGSEGGRGRAWVSASGQHHLLMNQNDPWRLCYPRDLEPKGWIPSDDQKILVTREEASHGVYCGFPNFYWVTGAVCQPDGSHFSFGFWPRTHEVFIGRGFWDDLHGVEDKARGEQRADHETWFYHADGSFAGWIPAQRIGDELGGGMLFRDVQDHVIALAPDLSVRQSTCFLDRNGAALRPIRLFSDLRLGFFLRDDELVLSRWKKKL